jgi:hypothetical protein
VAIARSTIELLAQQPHTVLDQAHFRHKYSQLLAMLFTEWGAINYITAA